MRKGERLGFDDVEILRLASPVVAGHTMKLIVVDAEPDELTLDELRRRVEDGLSGEPRSRQRVSLPRFRLGRPAWVEDPDFDLTRHVRRREASEGIDDAGLRVLAGRVMAERLDPGRPLWAFDLVGPLAGGGVAILARIHHAMADGIACLRFLERVLWDGGEEEVEGSGSMPDRSPVPRAGGALAALPGALRRELRPREPESRLARSIHRDRAIAFARAGVEELKRIGHSRPARATLNDVLLAALAGGLRDWLGDPGSESVLRAQVPVSLHHRDEAPDELGNRDSFLNLDLPIGEPDPLRRLDLIRAETRERKLHHDPEELYAALHALARVPPLYRTVNRLAGSSREFALAISNVPGPARELRVVGRPVAGLSSVAEPAPGHALRASAVSSSGTVSIALCTDPAAVAGVERLAAAIERALAELGAAA